MQRYLYPVARVCPKNKRHRLFFAAHYIPRLFHRNKDQSLGVMVAEMIINKLFLNGGYLEFSDDRAFWRCFYGSDRAHTTQRQQIFVRHGIRSDYAP